MTIYAKRLRGPQRAWALNYEAVTGFEPLRQDDYDAGTLSFEDFKAWNLRWLEDHQSEVFESARVGR